MGIIASYTVWIISKWVINIVVWPRCPKVIILWKLFIASWFSFDNIAQYNDVAQGIWTLKTFEYENTRSDFKCCNYSVKLKTIC